MLAIAESFVCAKGVQSGGGLGLLCKVQSVIADWARDVSRNCELQEKGRFDVRKSGSVASEWVLARRVYSALRTHARRTGLQLHLTRPPTAAGGVLVSGTKPSSFPLPHKSPA